jgi:hypothetical protein
MGTPFFREFYTKTSRVAIYFPATLERLAAIDENRAALGLPIRLRLAKGS